ncbi:MAG TPA: dihydrolipoamide acetyltransferase family protein, partial [Anaerovoracaceae bacterium]|nr:dihydrolipoamide acetyltransferase family protein [Anaerovoracaceae bacterium]
IMPRLGQSVESCIIIKWMKKEGDHVEAGDTLFSYETDKAAFEEVSSVSGILLKILAAEGDDVPCLDTVAIIGNAGEDISALMQNAGSPQAEAEAETKSDAAAEKPTAGSPVPVAGSSAPAAENTANAAALQTETAVPGEIKISPRAKAIAQNQMLDFSKAVPTGPNGRIIERDVIELSKRGYAAETEEPAQHPKSTDEQHKPANLPGFRGISGGARDISGGSYEDVPLTHIRKSIAKAMYHSISSMAQLTHSFSFDAANIIGYRKQLKENGEAFGLENITYNDMILFAVSRVLTRHRDLNTHFLDGKMRYFEDVNLGMAVDTPRGLLVPTIFGANKMSLNEIAAEAKALAKQAQSGTISPDYLQSGSFTISNLGSFDVEHFTPVINPPQTGIIGVNNIQVKIRLVDGQMVPYQAMGLSLTYDHRAVDGAPASRFMQELCRNLENFTALLAK